MDNLKEELKKHIIEQLNLEDVRVEDIADSDLLFDQSGLGLDSIDALELIVLLEKFYGIQVTKPEEGKEAFRSIETMAQYIRKRKTAV
ncbi:phosphopantetheine-binding protein [Dyadobacter sp. CY312]|uniref:phosphopantetheine-binding protein n=1 Tax=Dyadobacter sp. CY312 TaxID=2907303 RepID=UPI001EEA758C|nr:phosphopantetheine-binding protein [Dyadobacter sp. CY312]MCE7041529.1 phosphopantetheine-binding protein [Dyadobacter sp. CY312]